MRLARTSLLSRLSGPDAPAVIVLEAPSGYGKSWLARRAGGPGVVRLRGELGPVNQLSALQHPTVLLDDAHLLSRSDVELLVELIEDCTGEARLVISGRIVADEIHEVTQLVDGLIIGAEELAVTPDEIAVELGGTSTTLAGRLADTADGCVRVLATALEQARRDPTADPVSIASQIVRVTSEAAVQHLSQHERSVVALLARAPGIDRHLLDRLGGDRFVERAAGAGVPLRRQITGALELATASAFRGTPIEPTIAATLADDMLERGRAMEAIGLVLDAGDHARATAMFKGLNDSITDTVEPRPLLSLLARLGSTIEHEPALLLLRANAAWAIGRLDEAVTDIDRAVAQAADAAPELRRRVAVEAARARLVEGDRDAAERAAADTLAELGDGEGRTYASAHQVLAECAATSDAREDLQRAAESYRVAANAWEACGEFARARSCRSALALGVLTPLGRFDEALAQVGQLLGSPDLSEAERSWTVFTEGFVLLNANRLDSAEARFARLADLGYLHDNPRLIAAAAWGMALVASHRSDLSTTLRWIATAENTALGEADDVLGIPFLCDVVEILGALGELDAAGEYLARATSRRSVFPGQVRSTIYVLDARHGVLGDMGEALAATLPASWWRVKLVTAYAMASQGDLDGARRMVDDATRELVSLGFGDFTSVGEGHTHRALLAMLDAAPAAPAPSAPRPTPAARASANARRLLVMGQSISVDDGESITVVPAGNPQRLVGVLVAAAGSATIDQVSDAIWPGEDVETSRTRLRNVLLRLRRVVGDVIVRTGNGLRLSASVTCDLHEFQRAAADALSAARADPDVAGQLAQAAVAAGDAPVFPDFDYDDWAVEARRDVEQQLIGLLDLLSVQAEDAGDLPAAQALAERALRLDRYTDSRYVRLADLLTMQDRVAAAIAVLDDAAEVARELGNGAPDATKHRRDELLRRAVSRV